MRKPLIFCLFFIGMMNTGFAQNQTDSLSFEEIHASFKQLAQYLPEDRDIAVVESYLDNTYCYVLKTQLPTRAQCTSWLSQAWWVYEKFLPVLVNQDILTPSYVEWERENMLEELRYSIMNSQKFGDFLYKNNVLSVKKEKQKVSYTVTYLKEIGWGGEPQAFLEEFSTMIWVR